MKSLERKLFLVLACCSVFPAAGCSTLPWWRKKPAGQMTAQQYAEQHPADIQYDTSADPIADYYSPSHVASPPESSAAAASAGAGANRSGSCCH